MLYFFLTLFYDYKKIEDKMKLPQFSINQDILKIIALIAMTVDHIAKYLPLGVFSEVGRYIGRISFPIFAFLLMEHLYKKQIFRKYIGRLSFFGLFTFLLLLPFQGKISADIALPFNILISFLSAVFALAVFEWIKKEDAPIWVKIPFTIFNFLCFALFSLGCEYDITGFCYLIFIYFYFVHPTHLNLFSILLFSVLINMNAFQWLISLLMTMFLLCLKSDKVYPRLIKHWWSFYVFYPLHLFVLACISYFFMS